MTAHIAKQTHRHRSKFSLAQKRTLLDDTRKKRRLSRTIRWAKLFGNFDFPMPLGEYLIRYSN